MQILIKTAVCSRTEPLSFHPGFAQEARLPDALAGRACWTARAQPIAPHRSLPLVTVLLWGAPQSKPQLALQLKSSASSGELPVLGSE